MTPKESCVSRYADQQQTTNARTGKIERVFVDLEAIYPNDDDVNEEMSFEELRAKSRGWLSRDWAAESKQRIERQLHADAMRQKASDTNNHRGNVAQVSQHSQSTQDSQTGLEIHDSPNIPLENTIALDQAQEGKIGRPRKTKIREVKGETQTSMFC